MNGWMDDCRFPSLPGLDGEGFVEELLVEVFLDVVHQDDSHAALVVLRPAGPPHHLQYVRDGEVHVPRLLAVKVLRALHHHQVGGEIHPPGQGASGDQDLRRRGGAMCDKLQRKGGECASYHSHGGISPSGQGASGDQHLPGRGGARGDKL